MAKNITENFEDVKRPIAIFEPERTAKLHPTGKYLLGRVTLTNITYASTNATLNFHILKGTDEKDYMCKYYYKDKFSVFSIAKSKGTRILVKVPVRHVHINIQPIRKQYDVKTENITLTCKASGDPEPKYIWFKENNNNTIISGTNLYIIEDVIRNNSGVYICEAYNNINGVNYTKSNSLEINIVDEMVISQDPVSSSSSLEHAAYVVPVILVLAGVFIVSFLAVRKHRSIRRSKEKNIESRWHNILGCFNRRHGSDKNLSYAVFDKTASGVVGIDMKENEIICKNREKEENFDISQNLPTSLDNIYAVPCDTLPTETATCKIFKARGKNEHDGFSDKAAVYSEVYNKANMKSEMSKDRTSVHPENVDHNGDGISVD